MRNGLSVVVPEIVEPRPEPIPDLLLAPEAKPERAPVPEPASEPVPEALGSGNRLAIGRQAGFTLMGLVLVAANALVASHIEIPWISPLLGIAAVVGIPAFLIYLSDIGKSQSISERLGAGLILALGLLMLAGLAVNTILPHLGVPKPLAEGPVVLTVDALCLALGIWAYRRHSSPFVVALPSLSGRDFAAGAMGMVVVVLSVLGAIRLNNGAGGGLTLFTLVLAGVVFGLLLLWQDRLRPGTIPLVIYCVSLALLFMTSLRGWYTTGHDIQSEYRVFELTKGHGVWDMSLFRNAYNACLSITILPVMLARWTRVADPYVYKVFFQIIFAFCPVLVYRLATRVSSAVPALIGTIFFVSFVTFFQDMPMLNRQEIAFLFLVAGLLALFNKRLPIRSRQIWFGVFAVGMVLSHYSTTYVTLGVLGMAWATRVVVRLACKVLRLIAPKVAGRVAWVTEQREKYVIGLGVIAFLALAAFVWSGPITGTGSELSKTVKNMTSSLRGGPGADAKSSDIAYSIFGDSKASPTARLAEYKKASLKLTKEGHASGEYFDAKTMSRYQTPVVAQENLPLTALGKAVSGLGLDVASFNSNVRQASAKILQVLVLVGLASVLLARRRKIEPPPEFFFLAVATLLVVLLQVALPVLTVSYGLLRAFQQSLIVLAVFVAVGSLALVPGATNRWRKGVAGVLALAFFVSSTGVVTQLLGGYPAQLHLNNAGAYYDIYYPHPEEISSLKWLQRYVPSESSGGVQAQVQTDRYANNKIPTIARLNALDGIYPDLIQRGAYVFLGYTIVRKGTSTVSYAGDQITYRYPVSLLDEQKDLIYSSSGARVYR